MSKLAVAFVTQGGMWTKWPSPEASAVAIWGPRFLHQAVWSFSSLAAYAAACEKARHNFEVAGADRNSVALLHILASSPVLCSKSELK